MGYWYNEDLSGCSNGTVTFNLYDNSIEIYSLNPTTCSVYFDQDLQMLDNPESVISVYKQRGDHSGYDLSSGLTTTQLISQGYWYNSTLSKCTVGTINYNSSTKSLEIFSTNPSTCTAYFDTELEMVENPEDIIKVYAQRANHTGYDLSSGLTAAQLVSQGYWYNASSSKCTTGTITYNSSTKKLEVYSSNPTTCTAYFDRTKYSYSNTFGYTGGIQSFYVSVSGNYKLEVFGAQGGSARDGLGGKGGYSYGNVYLTAGSTIYIGVGGAGQTGNSSTARVVPGGYNGGGTGSDAVQSSGHWWYGGSGGGATHIALNSNLGELKNYSGSSSKILIVAGGGGGAGARNGWDNSGSSINQSFAGGAGGGLTGVSGIGGSTYEGTGGTQSSGGYSAYAGDGSFGQGGTYVPYHHTAGGGGGWYGGGGSYAYGSAGGGSSYIGSLASANTIANYNSGNGYARVTYLY